uniref:DUF4365 domain-containing protein n=1 Tax=Steinernema glaseri TaxID=37863 RepID=A0A1I7YS63_9BILA
MDAEGGQLSNKQPDSSEGTTFGTAEAHIRYRSKRDEAHLFYDSPIALALLLDDDGLSDWYTRNRRMLTVLCVTMTGLWLLP